MTDLAHSTPAPFRPANRRGLRAFNALEILAVLVGICFWSTGPTGMMIGIPIILGAFYSAFFIPPKVERGIHVGKCPHCGAEMSATHYQKVVDCPCCSGDVEVRGDRFVALPAKG